MADQEPMAPDGPQNGPQDGGGAEAPAPARTHNVGHPGGPPSGRNPEGLPEAAYLGEPDALPMTFCKKCGVEVRPIGKGRCGRCGTFLRLNFARRTHPVNVLRREVLLAGLLRQFPPANILEHTTCERLAGTMEQLEGMRPGSPEWQRLVQTEQTLAASLHDSRLSRETRPPTNLDAISKEDEDQLIARATAILSMLLEQREERLRTAARAAEDASRA